MLGSSKEEDWNSGNVASSISIESFTSAKVFRTLHFSSLLKIISFGLIATTDIALFKEGRAASANVGVNIGDCPISIAVVTEEDDVLDEDKENEERHALVVAEA